MTHTTDQERAEPIKMQPGDDLHLTMLMAPHGLNFVTGKDREHLLAWGRDVWQASRRAKVVPNDVVEAARHVHRLVRAHTFDMQHDDKAKPMWESCTNDAVRTLQYLVDAAAPQPPGAAAQQGVRQAYVLEDDGHETYLDGCESRFSICRADGECVAWVAPLDKDSGEAVAREMIAALNATHPTPLGLDAQVIPPLPRKRPKPRLQDFETIGRFREAEINHGIARLNDDVAWLKARDAICTSYMGCQKSCKPGERCQTAAQAKQGGAA